MQGSRYDLRPEDELVQDFIAAASERYEDGSVLLAGGRSYGSIYMAGYAAEMLLKSACFFFLGATAASRAEDFRRRAKSAAETHGLDTSLAESGHSVAYWYRLLLTLRRQAGRDSPFARELQAHVVAIHSQFFVEMRYRTGAASAVDARDVLAAVSWLEHNHRTLYT